MKVGSAGLFFAVVLAVLAGFVVIVWPWVLAVVVGVVLVGGLVARGTRNG